MHTPQQTQIDHSSPPRCLAILVSTSLAIRDLFCLLQLIHFGPLFKTMDQPRRLPKEGRTLAASQPHNLERRRAISRSSCKIPTSSPPSQSSTAMAIPSVRQQEVPPPLPPPRWNGELAQGNDVSWQWGNTEQPEGFHRLPPISSTSSLYGGFSDPRRGSIGAASGHSVDMELHEDIADRWDCSMSTGHSPSPLHSRLEDRPMTWAQRPTSPGFHTFQRYVS